VSKKDPKKVIPKSLNKNMRFEMEREKAEEQNRHSIHRKLKKK
jgi:hypothetical protein